MDEVRYCEYKILLEPQRFQTPDDFADFSRRVAAVALRCDVDCRMADEEAEVRLVSFFDTPGYDLYRNAYILRHRSGTQANSKSELTFKFRHPEVEKARRVDVRSKVGTKFDLKFKEEALQPHAGACGTRSVFSHNCVMHDGGFDRPRLMGELVSLFPVLATLQVVPDTPVTLVKDRTVEEQQVGTGRLDFGGGLSARSSVAIWRDRETGQSLAGEFSYQTKFENLAMVDERSRDRAEHLHFKIQKALVGWVSTGATKTSLIYGNGVGNE